MPRKSLILSLLFLFPFAASARQIDWGNDTIDKIISVAGPDIRSITATCASGFYIDLDSSDTFDPSNDPHEICLPSPGTFYNVLDFGATGDGTTDDTAAIQAAITAIESATPSGGTVYFPNPSVNYQVTTLTVLADGVRLLGESALTTKIIGTALTGHVIHVRGDRVQVEELTIGATAGRKAVAATPYNDTSPETGKHGILFQAVSATIPVIHSRVRNVIVLDQPDDGVILINPQNAALDSINSKTNGRFGFHLNRGQASTENTAGSLLDSCVADGNVDTGIFLRRLSSSIVNAARVENSSASPQILISGGYENSVVSAAIVPGVFQNPGIGIRLFSTTHSSIIGGSIHNMKTPIQLNTARGSLVQFPRINNNVLEEADQVVDIETGSTGIVLMLGPLSSPGYANVNALTTGATIDGVSIFDGKWRIAFVKSFSLNDTTPSVAGGATVFKIINSATTTITNFDDGVLGQEISVIVIIAAGVTTIDFSAAGPLKGNKGVDWLPKSDDIMHCMFDGTSWYCDVVGASGDSAGLITDFSNAADLDAAGKVADDSHDHTNLTGTISDFVMDGAIDFGTIQTLSGATPNVAGGSYWQSLGGSSTYTDFTGGVEGQVLTIINVPTGNITFDCTASGFNCGTIDLIANEGDVTVWQFTTAQWELLSFKDQSKNMNLNPLGSKLSSTIDDILTSSGGANTLILGGASAGAENIRIRFNQAPANEIEWSTNTGAAILRYVNVQLAGNAPVLFPSKIRNSPGDATSSADYFKGSFWLMGSATTTVLILPSASAGLNGCVRKDTAAAELRIQAAAADTIELFGQVGVAAEYVKSGGYNGEWICLFAQNTSEWFVVESSELWSHQTPQIPLLVVDTIEKIWGAGEITTTGTCADPADVQINSGPTLPTILCTDANTSVMQGSFTTHDKWDVGDLFFELAYIQTLADLTGILEFDIKVQCRAPGEIVNIIFEAEINVIENPIHDMSEITHTTNGTAVTCGSAAAGDTLFWKIEIDAPGTTALMATVNFIHVKLKYRIIR